MVYQMSWVNITKIWCEKSTLTKIPHEICTKKWKNSWIDPIWKLYLVSLSSTDSKTVDGRPFLPFWANKQNLLPRQSLCSRICPNLCPLGSIKNLKISSEISDTWSWTDVVVFLVPWISLENEKEPFDPLKNYTMDNIQQIADAVQKGL